MEKAIFQIVIFVILFLRGIAGATAIVGIVDDNGFVYIGGDSAGVAGYSVTIRADEKVFIIDNRFIIGFTDSFRMGQLLRYSCPVSEQIVGQSVEAFMSTTFIDSIRQCFGSGGYLTKKDGAESGGTFLVGYKGRLFKVYSDFQVAESVEKYHAAGVGYDIVLGSLFSTENLKPEERIKIALSAAAKFNSAVRAPFHILSLPQSK